MRNFIQDLRHGLRLLVTDVGFTLVAVLTLAIGIASTTTVFSWVDGILNNPYPGIEASHRMVAFESVTHGAPTAANRISYPDYRMFRDHMKLVSGLAAHRDEVFSVGSGSDSQPIWGETVSANYFEVLGVRASIGRLFTHRECGDVPGACRVVVVSHQFWRDRLGGNAAAVGRTLRVNRQALTVIGVTPPEFRGTMAGLRNDLWTPLNIGAELGLGTGTLTDRAIRGLDVLARLAPAATIPQCRAESEALAHQLASTYPETNRNVGVTVVPVGEMRSGPAILLRAPLGILLAVSVVVLLIVCANVANLLLARSAARTRELSLRMALGASRIRVAQQLIAETLPLAAAGSLAGLLLSFWMGDLLPLFVPQVGIPVVQHLDLNGRVLGFTILLCVAATLLSSIGLVLVSLRADVNEALKEGGRAGGRGRQSLRAQSCLVISQVALASLSLVSAGLFLRSFQNARAIQPGFDPDNVLLARFYVSSARYTPQQMHQYFQRLQTQMATRAGVLAASYGDYAPLGSNASPSVRVQVEGYVSSQEQELQVGRSLVAPGYLATLRIPLLEGRDFNAQDGPGRAPVVIVNRAFARRFYDGASPLGRRVLVRGQWHTVVGVAGDTKNVHPSEADAPQFYSPIAYSTNTSMSVYFVVRTEADPRSAIPLLRREAAELDPDPLAMQPMPLREWTNVTLLPQKLAAGLIAALGGISLLLAAVGLYSAMAYAVTLRTQEFGIRMALGASMNHVLAEVFRKSLWLTAGGLGLGLAGAAIVSRLVRSMLIQVSPLDPHTYAGVACFLVAVAVAACALPARRAARVDPMVAMRQS